jgi:DNA-binding NarL/FixJ family response regulator
MTAHLHLAPDPVEDEKEDSVIVPSPIRVVLADDHALMRHGLLLALEDEDGVEVVSQADDMASAVHQAYLHKPDVLVLDMRIRGGSAVMAIAQLRKRLPATKVVVLSMSDSPALAQYALACGAAGFVRKEYADDELALAVHAAAHGERYSKWAPAPGRTSRASAGGSASGANRPSTLPPKPPPTSRAPAAPQPRSRATAASTAGVEIS